ncbi:coiled-coil domain-containing protein 106-like [Chaetodon trifascialis]|uniref:coiled-coil domain-containing protein 106-like n=1 Tax=Chaetodon trifascialis TaxID=109706 RepID=UPI0039957BB0
MPFTRGKRRTDTSKRKSNPPDEDLLQSGNEVEEITHLSAPTTAPTMANLQEDYRLLKEENRLLKEENRLLKQERDFIKEKLKTRPSTSSKDKRKLMDSSESDSSDSGSDSSSEEEKRKKKRKNNKQNPAKFGKRVNTPEDVVHRYRAVLKEFRRTRSVSLSCKSLSVDRNTIALTAIIAEVLIAAEGEDFRLLPEFTEEDTIGNYAKTCKTFLEGS